MCRVQPRWSVSKRAFEFRFGYRCCIRSFVEMCLFCILNVLIFSFVVLRFIGAMFTQEGSIRLGWASFQVGSMSIYRKPISSEWW